MDKELYELCKEVYEKTQWKYGEPYLKDHVFNMYKESDILCYLYRSDYLLEKLPEEIDDKMLVVTNGERPHVGYAKRDNYGNYTLDDSFYRDAQESNEVRKALLKLASVLHDEGILEKSNG